jgi:hypothetical protein
MKTILLSTILSAATLVISQTSVAAQKSSDETAVQNALDASRSDFDKRDLTGFSALFIKSLYLYYQVYADETLCLAIFRIDMYVHFHFNSQVL